jgi:SAM-dependent methyltransferase
MKDNFSLQAAEYAQFRPGYPPPLFDLLFGLCRNFDCAWDCATGNGQIAAVLADRFRQVQATDISANQLANAVQRPNIRYQIGAAEAPLFSEKTFDLITVGQAVHWFDFEKFYAQVQRVLKPDGVLALVGYGLVAIDPPVDTVIGHLYRGVLGAHWDPERRHIDTALTSIPFPFREIPLPAMDIAYAWTLDHLLGYLATWSAVQHFEKNKGCAALDAAFVRSLKNAWEDNPEKVVRFPIFGRVGTLLRR